MDAEQETQSIIKRIRHNRRLCFGLQALSVLAFLLLQFWQLQYSVVNGIKQVFELDLPVLLLNLGILPAVTLTGKLLLQRWHWAMLLTACMTTVWSFVNFFVLKFHGSPLLFSEFRNFCTAMDVIGGYSFVWERRLSRLLILGAAEVGCAVLMRMLRGNARFFSCNVVSILSGQSDGPVYRAGGFVVCGAGSKAQKDDGLDLTTDVDYLEGFTDHSGAVYGKVVGTSVGGSTNNTEYELLTSNSLHLLTMAAPFNYLNLRRETKNIVSYLKPPGYTSLAMHCESGSNYSRNRANPELGAVAEIRKAAAVVLSSPALRAA